MVWIQNLSRAIRYIEDHLTEEISVYDVANQAYSSSSHFQMIFHMVVGITVGEYIRNRRLTLAAHDLLQEDAKIVDVAGRYQYDTQESFSKAFTRFHGVSPSKVKKERSKLKLFRALMINVNIEGGFDLSQELVDKLLLIDWSGIDKKLPAKEAYEQIVQWAREARGQNPDVFSALTEWILDDSEWTEDKLVENEQILMQGVFARFKEQNAQLRAYLKELDASGVVNQPVFKALDAFDDVLSGFPHPDDEDLKGIVAEVFSNFSVMRARSIREKIAGSANNTVQMNDRGYINYLKECDISVQWALFMPEVVKKHGHKINRESFEYIEIGKVRFIGLEFAKHPEIHLLRPAESLPELMPLLSEYRTENTALCHLEHHHGGEVNVNQCNMMGYFFKAGTPVPEGYDYYDVPTDHAAYAVYFHPDFDGDIFGASYEFTRDQILGDNVNIPYPEAYWTAEVYPEGFFTGSGPFRFGYLFSVGL